MSKEKAQKETYKDIKKINWLGHWQPLQFKSNPKDEMGIEKEKKDIRVYVRGWLAEYNADHEKEGAKYIVAEFIFNKKGESPLKFSVEAYLKPAARPIKSGDGNGHDHKADGGTDTSGGGHLIPTEPPPPGGSR